MEGRRLAVLGATGSIGQATIDVVRSLGQDWRILAVSAHRRHEELCDAVRITGARSAVLSGMAPQEEAARHAADGWPAGTELSFGPDRLVDLVRSDDIDVVVAAIVGRAGVESTLAALEAGKRVALANKETLVCAGPIVEQLLYGRPSEPDRPCPLAGAQLLPVDSEHSAIFQCLPATKVPGHGEAQPAGGDADGQLSKGGLGARESFVPSANGSRVVDRLILTASGGPFREASMAEMREATVEQALNHPTWNMGKKITIDSATMMNKALEIIEARWLFGFSSDALDVLVHPQSIIHSMVEYTDGSVLAQLSPPDMRLPIQYALTYPDRTDCPSPRLDRTKSHELTLQPVDHERFPAIPLGFEVAAAGGTAGSVVNAANEAAVDLFLREQIRFTDIVPACRAVLEHHTYEARPSLERLLELDEWARAEVRRWSCHTNT